MLVCACVVDYVWVVNPLLVVAGEASGDQAQARVLATLANTQAFGLAGPTMRAHMHPTDVLCHIENLTGMGIVDVVRHARAIASSRTRILQEAERRRPRAALLFNYSEFCTSLLAPLRALGVRTVFYSPPQVWAWRASRARPIGRMAGRILVTLPFEEALWRAAGANTTYVGHPAFVAAPEAHAKGTRIAILPGSRPRETACLETLLAAAKAAGITSAETCIFAAPSLVRIARTRLQRSAARFGVSIATNLATLQSFDAALCYSGTATLDCVLAGVPPVIIGPSFPGASILARALLRTKHIGLPNILLGRRAFAEHLGDDAHAIAQSLREVLASLEQRQHDCAQVRELLQTPKPAHENVARIVQELL
jgi:lipid-A-disaccharide synthase